MTNTQLCRVGCVHTYIMDILVTKVHNLLLIENVQQPTLIAQLLHFFADDKIILVSPQSTATNLNTCPGKETNTTSYIELYNNVFSIIHYMRANIINNPSNLMF